MEIRLRNNIIRTNNYKLFKFLKNKRFHVDRKDSSMLITVKTKIKHLLSETL